MYVIGFKSDLTMYLWLVPVPRPMGWEKWLVLKQLGPNPSCVLTLPLYIRPNWTCILKPFFFCDMSHINKWNVSILSSLTRKFEMCYPSIFLEHACWIFGLVLHWESHCWSTASFSCSALLKCICVKIIWMGRSGGILRSWMLPFI